MPTTTEPTWTNLTPAQRAQARLSHAALLDLQRRADHSSIDPVRMADCERRYALVDLADSA